MKLTSTLFISTLLVHSAVATCWKGYHYCYDRLNWDEQQSARLSLKDYPHHPSLSSASLQPHNPRHYLYNCLGNDEFEIVKYCESKKCESHLGKHDECKAVETQKEAESRAKWEEELERDWEAYLGAEGVKELEGLFKMEGAGDP